MKKPNMASVDLHTLKKYVDYYKVEIDSSLNPDSDEYKRQAVKEVMAQQQGIVLVAECSECGGESDEGLPECPYCGVGDESGGETIETNGETIEEEAMKKTSKKVGKKKVSKKKTSKKVTSSATAGSKKVGKKKVSKKKTSKKVTKRKEPVSILTSNELEKSMVRVGELKRQGVECMWELGKVLFTIYEKKQWTQMTADGKAVYDSFTKFCKNELKVDPRHAYRIMDVSQHFTKAQVAEVGVTKLNMLVRVDEKQREKLLESAKDTPRSKLQEEVSKLAQGKPRDSGREGFRGTSGSGRAANSEGTKKSSKLTIVRAEPRVTVELFRRGSTERAIEVKDACGVEQCANGVSIFYALVHSENGLELHIETRRDE